MKVEKKIEKKTIAAIVFGIVAVAVILYQMRGVILPAKRRVPPPTPRPATTTFAGASAFQTSAAGAGGEESVPTGDYAGYIAKLKVSDIVYESDEFKNPMTPLIEDEEEEERDRPKISGPATKIVVPDTEALAKGYTIEGIVWNEKDPLALVNDQVVAIGEELEDGAVVTEITRDTVRFSRNGNKYFLVLREE